MAEYKAGSNNVNFQQPPPNYGYAGQPNYAGQPGYGAQPQYGYPPNQIYPGPGVAIIPVPPGARNN